MIVVTGAAGFIGSQLVEKLNETGCEELILVDDFSVGQKRSNYSNTRFHSLIERTDFLTWFRENYRQVDFVYHLGARTDTTEFDQSVFDKLNLNYSKEVWQHCASFGIPLIYASSAATYGLGEFGYADSHHIVDKLQPLNPYGKSKNDFDKWALAQKDKPPFWAGLKFFNVYGLSLIHI